MEKLVQASLVKKLLGFLAYNQPALFFFTRENTPSVCPHIPAQDWVTHFKDIYNCTDLTVTIELDLVEQDKLSLVFTLEEAIQGIKSFTRQKAPGSDGIWPDLFVLYLDLWAPLMALIFKCSSKGRPTSLLVIISDRDNF